jgi:hypothetical protein
MLDKFKAMLLGSDRVAGAELFLSAEKTEINLAVLFLKKNLVFIDSRQHGIESAEKLRGYISADIPLRVVFNGKGILHKRIEEKNADQSNLISHFLPDAKASDFYIQSFTSGKYIFASAARKTLIDEQLQELRKQGFYIVSLSLGPFVVLNALSLLEEKQVLSFAGHNIILKGEQPEEYRFSTVDAGSRKLAIDKESIDEKELTAYAAALSHFSSEWPVEVKEAETVHADRTEIRNKRLFRVLSLSLGTFLGLLLIVNLVLKFSIDAENKTLAQKEQSYKRMLIRVDSLKNEVNEKNAFLTEAGWIGSSRISFMADRIASTVPGAIRLSEMSLYPKNDKLSYTQKKMIFDNHVILVGGRCSNPTDLNPWLKALKAFDWIGNASVMNYVYDEKEKQGKFIVEVKID